MNALISNDSTDARARGRAFIEITRAKLDQVLKDFADGKINGDQFDALYEHYQTQINGVRRLLADSNPADWESALDDERTIAIRKKFMSKATGMLLYLNRDGTLLEKMGDYLVDPLRVSELLAKLEQQAKRTTTLYQRLMGEAPGGGWLLLIRGPLATLVMVFSREPVAAQEETMVQLLQDFETANAGLLRKPNVTAAELAMPFRTIIKTIGRTNP